MSLRNVRKQKVEPGPKRGHGKFCPPKPQMPKQTNRNNPQTIYNQPSNSNTISDNFSSLVGHRLSDSTSLNGNSHILSLPAVGRRISGTPNSNYNLRNFPSSNRNVRTVPLKQDEKGNLQLVPNNGPKRGVLQGPSIMHNWSTISSKKSSGPMIVPLKEDENGKFHFIPNEGPKRGVYLGPGAIHLNSINPVLNGPKRGVGYMNIMSQLSADDKRAVEYVNNFRKENNLPPLQYSKLLSEIAMPHTLNMLNKKVPLGHSGFNERSEKVPSYRATGENVGYEYGFSDPMKTLFEGWLNSPPHRKNMLGNFNYIGVAFANKGDLWYGTQFFALI